MPRIVNGDDRRVGVPNLARASKSSCSGRRVVPTTYRQWMCDPVCDAARRLLELALRILYGRSSEVGKRRLRLVRQQQEMTVDHGLREIRELVAGALRVVAQHVESPIGVDRMSRHQDSPGAENAAPLAFGRQGVESDVVRVERSGAMSRAEP